MYNELFGLRKNPFNLTPDPAFLFLTEQHREALCGLSFAILQRRGFAVLTGDAGTGKTTLLARVLRFMPASKLQFSLILNPTLTASEFLELALLDFGLTDVPASKAQRIWKLQNLILQGQREGKVSALIVDEAHKLSPEVLEEIRLLGNFEQAEHKSLQILLVGQPELDEILNRHDLRQLKQRIGLRLTLKPLPPAQVGEYIQHRWLRAGGTDLPFSKEAIDEITHRSQGIPRVINSLCDNALLAVFAEGSSRVRDTHVREVAADLFIADFPRADASPKPPAPARKEELVKAAMAAPIPAPAPIRRTEKGQTSATVAHQEPKPSRWNRWVDRFRLTPRHEST